MVRNNARRAADRASAAVGGLTQIARVNGRSVAHQRCGTGASASRMLASWLPAACRVTAMYAYGLDMSRPPGRMGAIDVTCVGHAERASGREYDDASDHDQCP